MRRTFLICLFLLVCAAFAVTGTMAYVQFRVQSQQRAEQLLVTRLRDMMELVDYSVSSMQRLRRNNDDMALTRARALAEIIRLDPTVLSNQERLQGICNDVQAEQIAVTDEKGIILAAVPSSYLGYDLSTSRDAGEFMPCITTPGYEYVQRESEQSLASGLRYVGVHRADAPGLIRVGFRSEYEQRAKEATAYGRLAATHRLGTSGRIIGFRGGASLDRDALPRPAADFLALPVNQLLRETINGEQHFVYAVEKGAFRLVGIVPLREFYPNSLRNMRSRILTNSLIFAAVFALVSFLLQKLVINRIDCVNETLRRIADGDTEVRVNVSSSPEFVRLSTGINSMLDSIKAMNDQGRERLRQEMELARFMQRSTLPTTFPAFPNRSEFDIYATHIPSASVGGDFYDFFMGDADHLTFMLAAVSGTGVPAALFMMRSLSIIRNIARSEQNPQTVLEGANRALCEGRTADMHVSLFYGTLELSTGQLTCVNAGHDTPLLQHLGGSFEELELPRGSALGVEEGASYPNHHIRLIPGDRLFLYTDGLHAARNAEGELFSMGHLRDALMEEARSLEELPNLVRTALRRFIQGQPQEDDITLLALEYQSIMRHGGQISVHAGRPEPVHKLLQESLEAVFAAPNDIDLLQEAARGVLSTLPPETELRVILGCSETRAELSFSYPGEAVSRLEKLTLDGIDSTDFCRYDNGNRLTLTKTLA